VTVDKVAILLFYVNIGSLALAIQAAVDILASLESVIKGNLALALQTTIDILAILLEFAIGSLARAMEVTVDKLTYLNASVIIGSLAKATQAIVDNAAFLYSVFRLSSRIPTSPSTFCTTTPVVQSGFLCFETPLREEG